MTNRLFPGFPKLATFKSINRGNIPLYRWPDKYTLSIPRARWDYYYEQMKEGDYIILVKDKIYNNYTIRGTAPTQIPCYYTIPLKTIEAGKIKPSAAYNWRVRYQELPLVTAEEVTIIDENWINNERSA